MYDGDSASANQIASLCGSTIPGPILSTGNALFLIFESDGSDTASGFNGTFTFLQERPTTTVAPTPEPDGRENYFSSVPLNIITYLFPFLFSL